MDRSDVRRHLAVILENVLHVLVILGRAVLPLPTPFLPFRHVELLQPLVLHAPDPLLVQIFLNLCIVHPVHRHTAPLLDKLVICNRMLGKSSLAARTQVLPISKSVEWS